MGRAIEFTPGQRFSNLVVIGPTEEFKDSRRLWLCQCDCGNQAKIIAKHLSNGLMKSCGCLGGIKSFESGHRVGRLTVVGPAGKSDHRGRLWSCKCDCGGTIDVPAKNIKNGAISSCGCLAKDNHADMVKRNTKHDRSGTPLYRLWRAMIDRCHLPTAAGYSYYGGRGIEVCQRWREDFRNFLEDMGEPETGQSLDRQDVNGNYCKENCRWSSRHDQQNNRRNNIVLTHEGTTRTVSEWARHLGVSRSTIHARMRGGWTVDEVLGDAVAERRRGPHNARENAYHVWEAMKQRCLNPNCGSFRGYGGRGIAVSQRWKDSFQNFLEDMGDPPVGHSLERINVDGDYSKENCIWATAKQQANNKRSSCFLTYQGVTRTVSEWAEAMGTTRTTIEGRIRMGWPEERILSTPIRPKLKRA